MKQQKIFLVAVLFYILPEKKISVTRDTYFVCSNNHTQFEAALLLHSSITHRCTQNISFRWLVCGADLYAV